MVNYIMASETKKTSGPVNISQLAKKRHSPGSAQPNKKRKLENLSLVEVLIGWKQKIVADLN